MSRFHPIVVLPDEYDVYDFTAGYDPDRPRRPYGIGRYDEVRPGMYGDDFGDRCVHVGIDLGCPAGTPVHAPADATLLHQQDNARPGDYGPTLVLELVDENLWLLLGHLSRTSLARHTPGDRLARGTVVGHAGEQHENGGWNPHVHVQLCRDRPAEADLPGAVSEADRPAALDRFPDPRLILGPIY